MVDQIINENNKNKNILPPLVMRVVCLIAGIVLCFMTFLMPEKIDLIYGLIASGFLGIAGMFPAACKNIVLMIPDFFSRFFGKSKK